MIDQGHRRSGWRMVIAVVLVALLSCGVLISLAVRKVAAEKKVERKLVKEKRPAKPAKTFAPLREPENN